MSTEYEEGHPLYGRSDEWIAGRLAIAHECAQATGMPAGGNAFDVVEYCRKLREQAESSGVRITELHNACRECDERCSRYEARADRAEADIEFAKNELSVVRSLISGRDDRIEELEAKLEMTESTAAQLGIGPLRPPTPTQTDLSRIAASLEVIANAQS